MLSDELFNKLEEIGRIIKQSTKPFGGIQIVMSGDFYQLPPVKVIPNFVLSPTSLIRYFIIKLY